MMKTLNVEKNPKCWRPGMVRLGGPNLNLIVVARGATQVV